jgi:RNA polymerase subunit RPABC4/transcription elongation factor Spt4
MEDLHSLICTQHNTEKVWQQTVFEYSEDGVSVQVQNVWAWVCPEDGEPSFTPETVDALIVTIRELVDIGKRAKKRQPALTEYAIAVG